MRSLADSNEVFDQGLLQAPALSSLLTAGPGTGRTRHRIARHIEASAIGLHRVRLPAYTATAMPIYEFVCMTCESHFEELVRLDDPDPACPDCGKTRVARQLSVFAAHGTAEQPSFGGPSAGGGCCGGGCGCH
jgi:putative FmdB family regulatory protein